MGIYSVETKWNADEQKLYILMAIEDELGMAFLNYDYDAIYRLLRVYRLHTNPKFSLKEQEGIKQKLVELSNILTKYKKEKSEELIRNFYLNAENLFLIISQGLKEAGVYYREGRNASNAILQR